MRRTVVVVGVLLSLVFLAGGGYAIGATPGLLGSPQQGAVVRPGVSETPDEPSRSPGPSPSPSPSPTVDPPVIDDATRGGPYGSVDVTGSEAVALTFDDGPHPVWTPKVLAKLRESGVTATFCVIGRQARQYPELIREIVADGHTLCNHSWNHEFDLGKQSRAAIAKNLKRTNAAIRAAVPDARIGYFRQPGGEWTKRVISVSEKLGMAPVHWSVDPSDWNSERKATQINKQVVGDVEAGDIVLMHDGGGDRARTLKALSPILSDLSSRFILIGLP
ncbi:polysaccharide deacetylase family protein [Stackebrandtia soli]|uniref:polysaccharide deacetylase family protein n=1 Tax=Stackebrandtia soli TaxID=1892856 RepID=UPI0039ED8A6B